MEQEVVWLIEVNTDSYMGCLRAEGRLLTWDALDEVAVREIADEVKAMYTGGVTEPGVDVVIASYVIEELVIDEEVQPNWIPVDEGTWGTVDEGKPVMGYMHAHPSWCKMRLELLGKEQPNLLLRLRHFPDNRIYAYYIGGQLIDLEYNYRAELTALYLAYKQRDFSKVKEITERCYDPNLYRALLKEQEAPTGHV